MPYDDWDPSTDEPWDEHQWERFMKENDRRVDRYMTLLDGFLRDNPRPSKDNPGAVQVWKERLRAFVDRKGWTRDDLVLPFLWLDDDFLGRDEDRREWTAEREWELSADEDDLEGDLDGSPLDGELDFETDPLWEDLSDLMIWLFQWSDTLPSAAKTDTLVEVCALVSDVSAQVAKAFGFGTERDMIGANIACLKRAISKANDALVLLPHLREEGLLTGERYRTTYERLYEGRNAIGVRIQDLRARFNLGID